MITVSTVGARIPNMFRFQMAFGFRMVGHFFLVYVVLYEKVFLNFIKRPRLKRPFCMFPNVRFSNGRFHSYSYSYRHLWTSMEPTIRKPNIPILNLKMFGFQMDSVFEWIRFSNGRYSSPDCICIKILIIFFCNQKIA